MLNQKVALLFVIGTFLTIESNDLQNECRNVMEVFYQTEDQYFDLSCSVPAVVEGNVTLKYHCRHLQKKMDIFGKKYYNFGVNQSDYKNVKIWKKCRNIIFFK